MNQPVSRRIGAMLPAMSAFVAAVTNPTLNSARQRPDACDFFAGNPQEMPLPEYLAALHRWIEPQDKDWFGYKQADPRAREAAADSLTSELGMTFSPNDILLSRGASGALLACLEMLVDDGDEVIFISPPWFFYESMIMRYGGVPVRVSAEAPEFDLPLGEIHAALSPKTRAIIVNTPNNPTGRIYQPEALEGVAKLLEEASAAAGRAVYLLSDEAYSRILFDGNRFHSPGRYYPRSLLIHTYSKSALAPGQRLGFAALAPGMPDAEELRRAHMAVGLSSLPDAVMQYALPEIDGISIDLAHLQRKRDRMVEALTEQGYDVNLPESTFYVLGRSPIADDIAFAETLAGDGVVVLPGSAFEMPGYFRISLTATDAMVDRALPYFASAIEKTGVTTG
jgi:aspartate aminotransferase